MSPELVTSLGALVVGIIGACTSLFLALRKRIAEEDVPALKKRVSDLETLRESDRQNYERRLAEMERIRQEDRNTYPREMLALDRHLFQVERMLAAAGGEVPPRPRPEGKTRNGPGQ